MSNLSIFWQQILFLFDFYSLFMYRNPSHWFCWGFVVHHKALKLFPYDKFIETIYHSTVRPLSLTLSLFNI